MGDITADAIASLASKIEGLDLTEEEAAVVDAIIERATDDEVEGYGLRGFGASGSAPLGGRLGGALGFTMIGHGGTGVAPSPGFVGQTIGDDPEHGGHGPPPA